MCCRVSCGYDNEVDSFLMALVLAQIVYGNDLVVYANISKYSVTTCFQIPLFYISNYV